MPGEMPKVLLLVSPSAICPRGARAGVLGCACGSVLVLREAHPMSDGVTPQWIPLTVDTACDRERQRAGISCVSPARRETGASLSHEVTRQDTTRRDG